MTAIGTVAVAVVAVGVALFAEWRAGERLQAEHERSDRVLGDERGRHDREIAEERSLADTRLAQQLAHSDAQLADERAHSAAQFAEERRIAQEREQYAEAYRVRVLQGERDAGPPTDPTYEEPDASLKRLGAIIINGGAYTVTGVEARLRFADRTVVPFGGSERVTGALGLDPRLSDGMTGLLEALSHGDRLAPWDVGLRFYSDPKPIAVWYPIIRWTDRWGIRWEHRLGDVRRIRDGEQWLP